VALAIAAAALVGDAQVAGVDEADKLLAFLIERGVRALARASVDPQGAIARENVGALDIGGGVVAAVAFHAPETVAHCERVVHGLDTHVAVG
jgi:hypothetical protein